MAARRQGIVAIDTMRGLLLVWTGDAPAFTVLEPVDHRWLLGREHPAWSVPDDRMSRRHCEVAYAAGEWRFCDLGSVNGTRLDGRSFANRIECKRWRLLQVGRSLLLPCLVPTIRPLAADTLAAIGDWDTLQLAAWHSPPGKWRAEIPWWVHHCARILAPLTIDASVIAACLLHSWNDRCALLDVVRDAITAARDVGATSVQAEHLAGNPLERTLVPDMPHPRDISVGRGPGQLNRLRDPAVFIKALAQCEGDHGRGAAYLKLSAEAFEQWLRRHKLVQQ